MIIASPNQSASWGANVLVLAALAVPVLSVAIVFALMGAWLILPFAGVELLALGAALYHVNLKQRYRHVITVCDDSVAIDKGRHRPTQCWRFARHSAGLTITTQRHPGDAPALCVHDSNASVSLGDFLNREDSLKLIELLQTEIRVRARSARTLCEF
jgi:uncharacterized membrane protein